MPNLPEPTSATATTITWIGLLGTITLAQWSLIAGLVVAVLTAIYTCLNIYIAWRDKIARYRPPQARTRATDFGEHDATASDPG